MGTADHRIDSRRTAVAIGRPGRRPRPVGPPAWSRNRTGSGSAERPPSGRQRGSPQSGASAWPRGRTVWQSPCACAACSPRGPCPPGDQAHIGQLVGQHVTQAGYPMHEPGKRGRANDFAEELACRAAGFLLRLDAGELGRPDSSAPCSTSIGGEAPPGFLAATGLGIIPGHAAAV